MPDVHHQADSDGRGQEHGGGGEKCRRERQEVVGLPQQKGGEHTGRGKAHADTRPGVTGRWAPCGQIGGEVSGKRVQLGAGPRRGR